MYYYSAIAVLLKGLFYGMAGECLPNILLLLLALGLPFMEAWEGFYFPLRE